MAEKASRQLLQSVPGESGWPLLGHTVEFISDYRAFIDRMHRLYGSAFRFRFLFRTNVGLFEPEDFHQAMQDRTGAFSSKTGWDLLGKLFPGGLMLRDGDDHAWHRRIMASAFTPGRLASYLDLMQPEIGRQMDRWPAGDCIIFYDRIKQLTLDLAARVFLGLDLGPDQERVNRAFSDLVAASLAVVRLPVPGLLWAKGMRGRRFLKQFLTRTIHEKSGDEKDLLAALIAARSESGDRFTVPDVVDHMIFLMMAAHDTTTSALTSMAWALAAHPEWQEEVRREALAAGGEAGPKALRAMVKTEWVFREVLRLYPPLQAIPRALTRARRIGGYELPEGTRLSFSPGHTHRLATWWSEPDKFDPQRFSPEKAEHKQHPGQWTPFGGGAHTCIGQHFAMMQVKAVMIHLLTRFELQLPKDYQLKMVVVPIVKPDDGLPVRLVPRG